METQVKAARGGPDVLDLDKSEIIGGGGVGDTYGEDAASASQSFTPWSRLVARHAHPNLTNPRSLRKIRLRLHSVRIFWNFFNKCFFVLTIEECRCFSGVELLRDPRFNKGTAFSDKERDAHYLRGLLPPVVLSQDLQAIMLALDPFFLYQNFDNFFGVLSLWMDSLYFSC